MKLTVLKPVDIEAVAVRLVVPNRYGTEDIPADFPFRRAVRDADPPRERDHWRQSKYDVWDITVDIDTGIVRGWPAGFAGEHDTKPCDEGCYYLLGPNDEVLAKRESDYVPGCIPGDYGDYISFDIDGTGRVANWRDHCYPEAVKRSFFRSDED